MKHTGSGLMAFAKVCDINHVWSRKEFAMFLGWVCRCWVVFYDVFDGIDEVCFHLTFFANLHDMDWLYLRKLEVNHNV